MFPPTLRSVIFSAATTKDMTVVASLINHLTHNKGETCSECSSPKLRDCERVPPRSTLCVGVRFLLKTQEDGATRFETTCFDCPDWDMCFGCTIESGDVTPVCKVPLEHTSADAGDVTLKTLNIDAGYWRATNTSEEILACYNPEACSGGQTGADSFCASGYKGPCEGIREEATRLMLVVRSVNLCKTPRPRFLRVVDSPLILPSTCTCAYRFLDRLRCV